MFSKLEPPDGLYAPLLSFGLNLSLSPVRAVGRVSNSRSELHPPRLWFRLSCTEPRRLPSLTSVILIEVSWFGNVCLHATCQAMSMPISLGAGRLAGTEYRNLKADETFNWAQK